MLKLVPWKFILIGLFLPTVIWADASELPCDDVLAFTDRGSITDTACVVPYKRLLIESGYQNFSALPEGTLQNYPQTEVVLGLPKRTEFFVTLPSYNQLSNPITTGTSATALGLKHEVAHKKDWMMSLQGIITPPGGSNNFRSQNTSAQVNAIFNYEFNTKWLLAGMFGISSISLPVNSRGERFYSVNPSLTLSFVPQDRVVLFGELFAQTKTASDEGGGVVADAGMLYKLSQKLSLDLEVAQRLTGAIGGYRGYIGAGFTFITD